LQLYRASGELLGRNFCWLSSDQGDAKPELAVDGFNMAGTTGQP